MGLGGGRGDAWGRRLTLPLSAWRWAVGLAALAFIVFSLKLPLSLYSAALLDDALFWRQAEFIATGQWLGPYDQVTLAKGPGFSLLLALNAWLGLPLTLGLAVVQLLCASVLARELLRSDVPRAVAFVVWLVVLFQPACLPTRVVRDHLYQALTLVALAGLLHLLRVGRPRLAAARPPMRSAWAYGAALGLFLATREEGIWVAPAILLVLAWLVHRSRSIRPVDWQALARPWLAYAAGAALVLGTFCALNFWRYGAWVLVDFKSAPFVSALRTLNSIQVPQRVDFVPVYRQQRQLAYAVSPALRELADDLERPGHPLHAPGCELYPHTCGDFAGGWFMWALRDAVAAAGHFQSPAHADRYFQRVVDEVQAACTDGRLTCRVSGLPFLPRMGEGDKARLLPAFRRALAMSLYQEGVALTDGPSHGPAERLQAFQAFLGSPRHLPMREDDVWRVSGWYVSPQGRWIEARCQNESGVEVLVVPRRPSPDLVVALKMPGASHSRFSLDMPRGAECRLALAGDAATAVRLPDLKDNWDARLPDGSRVHVDTLVRGGMQGHWALDLKRALGEALRHSLPVVMLLALASACWAVVRAIRRAHWPLSLSLALLAWLLAAVRIGLLALVDATSFPGVNILYLAPAIQLWLVGALLLLAQPFLPAHETDHPDALPQRG